MCKILLRTIVGDRRLRGQELPAPCDLFKLLQTDLFATGTTDGDRLRAAAEQEKASWGVSPPQDSTGLPAWWSVYDRDCLATKLSRALGGPATPWNASRYVLAHQGIKLESQVSTQILESGHGISQSTDKDDLMQFLRAMGDLEEKLARVHSMLANDIGDLTQLERTQAVQHMQHFVDEK